MLNLSDARVLPNVSKAGRIAVWVPKTYDSNGLATAQLGRAKKDGPAGPSRFSLDSNPCYLADGTSTTGSAVLGSIVTEVAPGGSTTVSTSRSTPPPATLPVLSP